MPTNTISVTAYNGSLLTLDSLSDDPNLVLSGFQPESSGELKDNEGTLSVTDDGLSTFDGDPIEYVGSGTIRAGVQIGSVVVPLGAEFEIVIFNANGQTYFYFPDGEPVLDELFAVLSVDDTSYEVFPNPYVGTGAADFFTGDDLDNGLMGRGGDDTLFGGEGADTIGGGFGEDNIRGDAGEDFLAGGGNNDTIDGGAGADTINGGSGDDDLAIYHSSLAAVQVDLAAGTGLGGEATGDVLISIENVSGSEFGDSIAGDALDNLLLGQGGDDTLFGGNGNDELIGEAGADNLMGEAGDDTLSGGAQDDALSGGFGKDSLYGGSGEDTLNGGGGDDRMTGGGDSDTFEFRIDGGRDLVMDFEDNVDTLAIDESYWGGGLSVEEMLATYAHDTFTKVVIDFGDNHFLQIIGMKSADLVDDIILI